jgi:hypothetical protein
MYSFVLALSWLGGKVNIISLITEAILGAYFCHKSALFPMCAKFATINNK